MSLSVFQPHFSQKHDEFQCDIRYSGLFLLCQKRMKDTEKRFISTTLDINLGFTNLLSTFLPLIQRENKQIVHQECMWICSSSMHIDETDIFLSGMLKVYTRKKTAQSINPISNGWFKINSKAVRRHLLMVGIDKPRITILYL